MSINVPDAYPAQPPSENKPNPFASPDFLQALRRHWKPSSFVRVEEAPKQRSRQQRYETYARVNHWRARNPERARALGAVANAIKNYELERGTSCALCGSERNIVAGPISLHPVRVVWHCRRCSNELRRQARPPVTESARHAAQARRKRRLFRRAEAALIAEKQFRIRCERAVMIIARTGADTNVALRAVGLHNGTKARETVTALCDLRGIARRYWWGFPRWKTQTPQPVTVMSRRKEIVRPRDEENR
jgi:hypothetical protein